MSGLLWFIAGFVSCLLVSLLGVSLFVWRTPPAREQVNDENLPRSQGEHRHVTVVHLQAPSDGPGFTAYFEPEGGERPAGTGTARARRRNGRGDREADRREPEDSSAETPWGAKI